MYFKRVLLLVSLVLACIVHCRTLLKPQDVIFFTVASCVEQIKHTQETEAHTLSNANEAVTFQ